MKKYKILKISLISLAILLTVFFIGAYAMFGTQFKAANTIKKLDNHLYSMEYAGDYGFDTFLAQGGAASDAKMADYIASFLSHGFWKPDTTSLPENDFGCSTIAVKNTDGKPIFGRNYDWESCDTMIVHTKPQNGWESVSTVCLDFLGFGKDWVPTDGIQNRFLALAAVYVPLDGMNERGLCVAVLMAGDKEETHQNTDKPDLTVTAAIRLLLDHAANIDEALSLLSEYDMNSSIGSAHHFSLMDATGRSVVVEYVGNKMIVTETAVVTNHYLSDCEKKGVGSEESHLRYNTLARLFHEKSGIMTTDEVAACLAGVAQKNFPDSNEQTQWSIVYSPSERTMEFYFRENYEKTYPIRLCNKEGSWLLSPKNK